MTHRFKQRTPIILAIFIICYAAVFGVIADEPTERTRTLLHTVSLAIGEYRDQNGQLPAEGGKGLADALLKGSPPVLKLPPDRLNAGGEIIDFWGRPIRYRVLPGQKYVVYSVGANGRDEGGSGDDFGFQR